MKSALIDAGPCIALFDSSDKFHQRVKDYLQGFHGSLISSWPVITEVLHMIDFDLRVQVDFLRWLERGAIHIASFSADDLTLVIDMTVKYADRPMDFADATLLLIADKEQIGDIITIDSDFVIYRTPQGKILNNLLV